MAYANSFKGIMMAIAVSASTAVMLWFGNGLDPWWPLMWFAPLPVLWFALRRPWWVAALTAGAAWLAGSLNLWGYFHLLGLSFSAWLGIFGGVALMAAAAVLLFRALALKGAWWSAVVAFPAAWVTLEWMRNLTTPHGTAASLSYTQLKFLPFLQLASITGPWGMTFLLLCFPAALAIGLDLRKRAPQAALRIVATTLGVVAAVLIFGGIRMATTPRGPLVKVGLVASDLRANVDVAESGAAAARLFESYAVQVARLASQGAQAIVLPEKLGVVMDAEAGSADAIFQPMADRTGATIVVGDVHVAGSAKYNRARIYQPHAAVLSYDKHHMLPPFESPLTPGTTLVTLPRPEERWGVAICKDMDFTPLSRKYGEAGVGLMLAPAWDFNLDRNWHGHMAVMRAVEDGFSLVRVAKNGYLTVSDNRGRVLAETRSDAAPFATVIAMVPAAHSSTLYLLLGDWFAWLACTLLLFAIVQVWLVRRASEAWGKEQPGVAKGRSGQAQVAVQRDDPDRAARGTVL